MAEYSIKANKLDGVPYIASPNVSGAITPKFIVMHYTAGYNAAAAISTFKNKASKVSAHLVIDLDGTVTQMVPFNVNAWHAGPSKHAGYTMLNGHAIGIEIVNIGFLKKQADGSFVDAYGNKKKASDFPYGLTEAKNARVGGGVYYWPNYSPAQLAVLDKIVPVLIKAYNIKDIVSHEEIDTRGWKTDPGPAFDLGHYKQMLYGRDDTPEDHDLFAVDTGSLNVRAGGGTQWPVIAALVRDTEVEKTDAIGDWYFVNYAANPSAANKEKSGWVMSRYLKAK